MAKRYIDITEKVRQYFAPSPNGVRARDVVRELPQGVNDFSTQMARGAVELGVNTAASLGELGQNIGQGTMTPDSYQTWNPVPMTLGGDTRSFGTMRTFQRQAQGEPGDNTLQTAGNIAGAVGNAIAGPLFIGGVANSVSNALGGTANTFLQQPMGNNNYQGGGINLQPRGEPTVSGMQQHMSPADEIRFSEQTLYDAMKGSGMEITPNRPLPVSGVQGRLDDLVGHLNRYQPNLGDAWLRGSGLDSSKLTNVTPEMMHQIVESAANMAEMGITPPAPARGLDFVSGSLLRK